jgi:quercetin dioxygenase-like cupin family protein
MLVGAFAIGGAIVVSMTFKIAQATPPQGLTATPLAGPIELDEFDVMVQTDDFTAHAKTHGVSDAYVTHLEIVPGGNTGWHSHPGLVFALVRSGELTLYDDDFTRSVYPAGTGFAEEPGHVHIGVNEGDTDLEVIAFFLSPRGAGTRIDQPAPQP